MITIRALFRKGHDIPIIAVLLDKRFENPKKVLIEGIQSNLHTRVIGFKVKSNYFISITDPLIEECLCLRIQTKNSEINDLAEDLAISWTFINKYTNTTEVKIKEINNKIIKLFEPNKFTTEIQPKLLHLRDLSIPRDWMIEKISSASTSKP
ncbi:hypothetical protein Gotur_024024, partial [Gossypium turneri]